MLKTLNMSASAAPASLPASVDLRAWCSPIEDQKDLGSCTAQAGIGLIEFYENKEGHLARTLMPQGCFFTK
jgi:C1A family cysteine protease